MTDLANKAAANLAAIRQTAPLIHNITNFVVMNYTANALLAMGASPVMAHADNEVAEMVSMAGALVLNIGTLSEDWVAAMVTAAQKATDLGTPVVLDPVGAGATTLRTRAAREILDAGRIGVVRGNASEIISLGNAGAKTKGVDSLHSVEEAAEIAQVLADELDSVVAITGSMDMVTDGQRTVFIRNGHPLMARITGTGCTASAIIGAFLTVDEDPLSATATALAFFGLAGEAAALRTSLPGTFREEIINALYLLTPAEVASGCQISE